MTGQADSAPETGGLDDLASFLEDTPEQESEEQETEATQADDETLDTEDNSDDANDGQDDVEGDEPEADEPAPVEKITFKVKNADGKEETVEATTEEIANSYMRQADYTRKAQALSERESEAVKFLTQKHEEVRNHYLSQAELARAAVTQMAGIKTESEMAQLAQTDPAAWVAESQRQQAVAKFLSQLDQQINGERTKAEQEAEQARMQSTKQAYERTWAELQKDGIDRDKLAKIYGNVTKNYGFSEAELASVYDHRQVRLMKDAIAFRELQAQKAAVTKKVQEAPRMPSKQTSPAQTRQDQALENKFKGGRAKLNDLAAYLR